MKILNLVKHVRVLKASSVFQRWYMYSVLWLNNKAYTPDNPGFSLHIYAASLHWITMAITSIGYGDIVLAPSKITLSAFTVSGPTLSAASAAHSPRATLPRSASRSTPIC